MNASDLMIEDWIIYKKDYRKVNIDTFRFIKKRNEFFKPILITPEILEKNGFEFNDEKYLLNCWVENSFIDYDLSTCYFMIVNKGRTYEGEIQYIHELQHALRLCRIDKKIIL